MNTPLKTMNTVWAAETLAGYACGLRFENLPPEAVRSAKICLIDAIACAAFGARFPWSRMIGDVSRSGGGHGKCSIPGSVERVGPREAALMLGAFAHAFELDSLRKPGAGVHPGATVALPAFAMAQSLSRSGRDLIAAIVAGCEVGFRIGAATLHTPESAGFHAPGITGPFCAAIASGSLLELSAERMTCALAIAGSFAGGLLAFARSGQGGMVKRLHLGRAAESGVLAALLAAQGYEGPKTILEGEFGILSSFCPRSDPALLTKDLGKCFEITRLCIKRYACHVTAQGPIQLLRDLMDEHGFSAKDIAGIDLAVSAKVASHHSERQPTDIMLGQYSVPFSLALSANRDPEDPLSFSEDAVKDPNILDLAARISTVGGEKKGWGADLSIHLGDGRRLTGAVDTFKGCPESPLSLDGVAEKFKRLLGQKDSRHADTLLQALLEIEKVPDLAALEFQQEKRAFG